ncbi:nuclear transport factor 2 family protein [Streptomyces cinereospinus]|uniref:Nuclear transport factor 2 family protein n=1 Tax=Streptomyces cinereospinus TaxID=285561 RepID=A0ABV5NBQ2_9ACTN
MKMHGDPLVSDYSRDVLEIRQVVENWAVWRDSGAWEKFASVWHDDGYMSATWFQGSARDFIDASRQGFANGVRVSHFLGGTAVEVTGTRAVSQTKMTITQRVDLEGVEVDVVCTGRFYDFMERRNGVWAIVRRQPIYEQDRLQAVDPSASVELDQTLLAKFPVGYRYLAYVQTANGMQVAQGEAELPGLVGAAVERLYDEGRAWLSGSISAGVPVAPQSM